MNKKGMLGQLIGAFIAIVIAIALFPMITEALTNVTMEINNTPNVSRGFDSGMGETMLTIIPIFFGLAILLVVLGVVFNSLRSSGLIGGGSDDEEDEDEDEDEDDELEEDDDESFKESETEELEKFKEKETEKPIKFKAKETFHKSVSEKKLKKSRFD